MRAAHLRSQLRFQVWRAGSGAGVLLSPMLFTGRAADLHRAASELTSASSLYVVAHADDPILFQSPDLLHDLDSGQPVRTVVLTAGDNGRGKGYWSGREAGLMTAYAKLAGLANSWRATTLHINGHRIAEYAMTAHSNVVVDFLRLPDGCWQAGDGWPRHRHQSLKKLWNGSLARLVAVDKLNSYTKDTLTATLAAIMQLARPTTISVQDYVGTFGDGDHPDHHAGADFAVAANQSYRAAHILHGYADYATADMPANVSGKDLAAKTASFYAYARFDPLVCQSPAQCAGKPESAWLRRQYVVGTIVTSRRPAPPAEANVADSAAVTASSQTPSTQQTAGKAVDGVVDGYPGDSSHERASSGGGRDVAQADLAGVADPCQGRARQAEQPGSGHVGDADVQ